jgi:hypothetical protein
MHSYKDDIDKPRSPTFDFLKVFIYSFIILMINISSSFKGTIFIFLDLQTIQFSF